MDVEEVIAEEVGLDPQLEGVGSGIAHRRPGRFLHDLADLSGQGELALPFHGDRFHRHHVAPVLVDGHAGRRPHLVLELGQAELESGWSEVADQVLGPHHRLLHVTLGDPSRDLAADVGDLPVQVAHAGLVRVLANQGSQRRQRQLQVLRSQAVLSQLAGLEELFRDTQLFLVGVAR